MCSKCPFGGFISFSAPAPSTANFIIAGCRVVFQCVEFQLVSKSFPHLGRTGRPFIQERVPELACLPVGPGGSRRLGRPLRTEAHSSPGSRLLSSRCWPSPCKTPANSIRAAGFPPPHANLSPHLTDSRGARAPSWQNPSFFLLQPAHISTDFSSGELQTSQLCHTITFQRFKTDLKTFPGEKEFQLVYNLFLAISFPSPFNPPPALHIKIKIKNAS